MSWIATWVAGALALGAAACTVTINPNGPDGGTDQGASGYFVVTRPDVRRCAAPLCGGYFVRLVNEPRTMCADGELREECHVYDVDLSGSGLSPAQAAAFERRFGQRNGLARGTLRVARDARGLPVNTLDVGEAWRGVARTVPKGATYQLRDSGIQCITFPCPTILESRLNTGESNRIHGVDLAAPGVRPGVVAMGLDALYESSILVAGLHRTITGPAGVGTELVATEWYLREPVSGLP